jgi:hypothetical protein
LTVLTLEEKMSLRPTVLSPASLLRRSIDRHLREVHGLSRRTFLQSAAGSAGLALTASLGMPRLARAKGHGHDLQPKPIPVGAAPLGIPIHHIPVQPAAARIQDLTEPSQITDFNGLVGLNRIRGAGRGAGFADPLAFQADMGFMSGKYIGEDGEKHNGTFVFI